MFDGQNLRSTVDPVLVDYPDFAALRAYWEVKRAGRALPDRSDIDPIELKDHLGNLFIAEPLPDLSDFRYRLVGTNLTWIHGHEYTGRLVSDVFAGETPELAGAVLALYRKVMRETAVLLCQGILVWRGQERYRFASLHLPLATPDGGRLVFGKMLLDRIEADPNADMMLSSRRLSSG